MNIKMSNLSIFNIKMKLILHNSSKIKKEQLQGNSNKMNTFNSMMKRNKMTMSLKHKLFRYRFQLPINS